jgi:hypothetical protein
MKRTVPALLVLATLGCGGGRSKMLAPPSATPDAAPIPLLPDGAPLPDGVPTDGPPGLSDGLRPGPDGLPPLPEVPPFSDGPPNNASDGPRDLRLFDLPSEGPPPPDGPPPVRPDLPREGPPPIPPDARPDGLPPITPEVGPDGPPPVRPEVRPDGPPITPDVPRETPPPPPPDARPETRPPRPDTGPPPDCTAGAACTADCSASCNTIGTMTCTCANGVLVCGDCQLPPITISPEPCPDNPSRTDCPTSGLACFAYGSSGSISGACVCLDRGNSGELRWMCILR